QKGGASAASRVYKSKILHRNEKSGKAKNPPPSFPRKRESRILMPQEFIKDGRGLKVWIPACAGMTV
ncbi:hypothetical protein, partial [Neisseria meningitidis]|uniref:hypothetical protein n=1 Tax=Neisseria meningitidis TaxID=487 RepID=UPI000FF719EA